MKGLVFHRGVYHYYRRVPSAVLAIDPQLPAAVRRSTGTDRLREAQAIVREWATEDETRWLGLLTGREDTPWLVALRNDRDLTVALAGDAIEGRAATLRVTEELEAARSLAEIPSALRTDPKSQGPLRALYAARGVPMTWTQAWDAFEGRSALATKTRLTYASSCAQFDRMELPGPADVTKEDARAFLRRRAQEVTRSTVNIHMAAATAILTDLFDGDAERTKLFRGHRIRYAKEPQQRDPYSREDLRALLATGLVSRPLGLFLRLALGTGARREEVYSGDYDLGRRVLVVRREIAKNKSSVREVPLAVRLVPVAEAWTKARLAREVPDVRALQAALAKARKAAGLPASKTFHSCRHSFITELARADVAENRRKKLTGHSPRDVHTGYIHLTVEDLRNDVECVDFETGLGWP